MKLYRNGRYWLILFSLMSLVLVTITALRNNQGQRLIIKEVCPHNATISYDKIGRYSDYIVISNPTDETVNLEGFSLSDDSEDLRKYYFPAINLLPHQDIMVRAATMEWYHYGLIDRDDLFTGFSLHDGEPLYLTAPDGSTEDYLVLPEMEPDMIYVTNGNKREVERLPEKENVDVKISDELKTPEFMKEPGYYDARITLEIKCNPGEEIYYTLNGENPYCDGMRYIQPLELTDPSSLPDRYTQTRNIVINNDCFYPSDPVDKAVVIRAVAKDLDGNYSRESVGTYFIGDRFRKTYFGSQVISMVADPEDLFSEERGIYVSGKIWDDNKETIRQIESDEPDFETTEIYPANFLMKGRGWKREATLEFFDDAGRLEDQYEAFIGIRGNTTRFLSQKSFNVYPKESGKNISLRHGAGDNTGIKEDLCSKLAEGCAVGAQKASCCQLFLNGEYWGTYTLQEKLDEGMIENEYGVSINNINLVKDYYPVSGKEDDARQFEELREYIYSLDMEKDQDYAVICDMIDIDSLIDYYCMEIYLNNDDFEVHNFAIWRARGKGSSKYEDGKWRFLLYDLDSAMRDPRGDLLGSVLEGGSFSYDILAALYKNEVFRKSFENRMLDLSKNECSYENIVPLVQDIKSTYMRPMILSNRRFENADYDESVYNDGINDILSFFRNRPTYINETFSSED